MQNLIYQVKKEFENLINHKVLSKLRNSEFGERMITNFSMRFKTEKSYRFYLKFNKNLKINVGYLFNFMTTNQKNNIPYQNMNFTLFNKKGLFIFTKHYFSEFYINKKALNKKKYEVEIKAESTKTRYFIQKKLNRLLALTIISFLIFWGLNGIDLFRKLEFDKKYLKKIKEIEKENNIDINYNNKIIEDFDQKYGINKALNDYINKLQYGNKDFNTIDESVEQNINEENIREGKNLLNTIDLASPIVENDFLGEENKDFRIREDIPDYNKLEIEEKELLLDGEDKRNVRKIKADGYEQISVYQKNFNNPDPRILGSTIVFDSRLDKK